MLESPLVYQITDVMDQVIRHNIRLLPGAIVEKITAPDGVIYKLLWTSTQCTYKVEPLLEITWSWSSQDGLTTQSVTAAPAFETDLALNTSMTKWLMRVRQGSSKGTFVSQAVMWTIQTMESQNNDYTGHPIQKITQELIHPSMIQAVCASLSTLPYVERMIQSMTRYVHDPQEQWRHLGTLLKVGQFDSGIIDEEVIISSLSEPWMADSLWASHLVRLSQLGHIPSSSPIIINEYNDYLCIVPTPHDPTDSVAPMCSVYAGNTRNCSLEVTGTIYQSLMETHLPHGSTFPTSISAIPMEPLTNASIPSADPDYATRPLWRSIAMSTHWRVPTIQDILDWIKIEPAMHEGLHPMMGHDDDIGSIWLDLWSAVPEHAGRLYAVSVVYDDDDIQGRLHAIRTSLHPTFNPSYSLALPDPMEKEVF